MKTGITLLTMGAGNVKVLRQTLDSFKHVYDEVVFGDLLLFPDDRDILNSYKDEYNIKIVGMPFNYIYKNGFSNTLNFLAACSTNNMVFYQNVSEVIDEDYGMSDIIKSNPECNSFYFTHREESHRWFRCYNKNDLKWSGLIHEELVGEYRPFHKPIFCMKDLEKDMDNTYKAKILNSVKEIVYWRQLMRIVDDPSLLAATGAGWLQFAKENYDSMKERLSKKGRQPQAFDDGDLSMYFDDVENNPDFAVERFESTNLIAFQGDKIHLL